MEKENRNKHFLITPEALQQNQQKILFCLKTYTSIMNDLYHFEGLLYDKTLNLSRNFFKHFRNIRQGIESSSNMLEEYISFNNEFIQEKEKIIEEQITLTQSHISKGKLNALAQSDISRKRVETDYKGRFKRQQHEPVDAGQLELLKGEIQSLKNQLRKNDSEYEIEIKKYNLKYQQMQEEIRFYEQRMGEVEQYLDTIDKLQVQIRVMKQIKERDEQLLRNMARKLKNYELMKNGRSMMLSPGSRMSHNTFLSPSRVTSHLSPSRVTSHLSPTRLGSKYG